MRNFYGRRHQRDNSRYFAPAAGPALSLFHSYRTLSVLGSIMDKEEPSHVTGVRMVSPNPDGHRLPGVNPKEPTNPGGYIPVPYPQQIEKDGKRDNNFY